MLVGLVAWLVCATAYGAVASFEFHVPEGWTTIKDAKRLEEGVEALRSTGAMTKELAEKVRSTEAAISAERRIEGRNFAENMTAIVRDGAAPITQEGLDRLVDDFRRNGGKTLAPNVTLRSAEVITISGVACGKILSDTAVDGTTLRSVLYLLPSRTQMARVTFTAPSDVFEQHRTLYETVVASTGGITQPPMPPGQRILIASGVVAAVSAAAAALARRRRASQSLAAQK